jgi:hypothetical protein
VNWDAAVASATATRKKHCSGGERPIKLLEPMCELFMIFSHPAVAMLCDSINYLEFYDLNDFQVQNCAIEPDANAIFQNI